MKRSLVFAVWLGFILVLSFSVASACTKGSADLNGDGNVDSVDSEVISSNYGRVECEFEGNNWCSCSDINQDGKVDLTDFSIFAQKYSSECIKYSADLNFDGNVDMADHGVFAGYYGDYQCSLTDDWCGCADINQDDIVDLADYVIFVRQYNSCGEGYILEGDKCVKQTCEQIGGDVCRISLDNADNLGDGICENYGCWKCEENYIWDGSSCICDEICEEICCDSNHVCLEKVGAEDVCVNKTCEQFGGDGCTSAPVPFTNSIFYPEGSDYCIEEEYLSNCVGCDEGYYWDGFSCIETCETAGGDACTSSPIPFANSVFYQAGNNYCNLAEHLSNCVGCDLYSLWDGAKCNKKICVEDSADLDFDEDVDLADYDLLNFSYARFDCDDFNNWCDCADINQNGEVNSVDFDIFYEQFQTNEVAQTDDEDTETNGNDGTSVGTDITTNCEDRGYYCMLNPSCQSVGGSVLGYDCVGSLVCCNRREKIQETCGQKDGEICDIEQECEGGMIVSSFDLGYGERCCVDGTCERKVYVSGCEQNHGNCRNLCNENEEETSYDCDGGNICCIKTVFLEQRDGYWKILSFVFLSLFAVAILVAIIIKKERKNNFPVN